MLVSCRSIHALGPLGDLCLPLVPFVTGSTRNPRPQPSAGHNAGGPILPPRAPGTASSNLPTMSLGFITPAHAPGNSTHHDDACSTHSPTRTSPAHLTLPATGPLEFSSQSGVSHILLRVGHYLVRHWLFHQFEITKSLVVLRQLYRTYDDQTIASNCRPI
jgi:hypothetical protein